MAFEPLGLKQAKDLIELLQEQGHVFACVDCKMPMDKISAIKAIRAGEKFVCPQCNIIVRARDIAGMPRGNERNIKITSLIDTLYEMKAWQP